MTPEKLTRPQQCLIFAHCAEHGIDDETRRAAMEAVTGKRSTTELTKSEARRVIDHLMNPTGRKQRRKPKPRKEKPPENVEELHPISERQKRLIGLLLLERITSGRMSEQGFIDWGTKLCKTWPPKTVDHGNALIRALKRMNAKDGLWVPDSDGRKQP